MMHRIANPRLHLNHFTPFVPAGETPESAADYLPRMEPSRQRPVELALLAIIALSLGAAIAGMI